MKLNANYPLVCYSQLQFTTTTGLTKEEGIGRSIRILKRTQNYWKKKTSRISDQFEDGGRRREGNGRASRDRHEGRLLARILETLLLFYMLLDPPHSGHR